MTNKKNKKEKKMSLYLSIIGCIVLVLYFVNIIFDLVAFSNVTILIIILGGVLLEVAIDGLIAILIHLLPTKWFEINKRFFNVSSRERKFYEKIKIRKWKDKVVELGSLGGFSKSELKSSTDINYIKQFIIESNKGVVNHLFGCVAGFLILWLFPSNCLLCISLPIAIANLLLNIPSTFILRYNTPKLLAGYKRLVRNNALNELKEAATNKSEA